MNEKTKKAIEELKAYQERPHIDESPAQPNGDEVRADKEDTIQSCMNLVRFGWDEAAEKILAYCNENKVTPQFTDFLMSMLDDKNKEAFIYEKFEAAYPGAASRQPEVDALREELRLERKSNKLLHAAMVDAEQRGIEKGVEENASLKKRVEELEEALKFLSFNK